MAFTASAPGKCILFGEHYVVYGAPALAAAIEPRNSVEFSDGAEGVLLESALGKGRISPDGDYSGAPQLGIYASVARQVFGASPRPSCAVSFKPGWSLKGVGVSASLCAALAAGFYRLKGKRASADEIFAAAQAGDLVAHGGRASGIDAKTVAGGGAITFQRRFGPPSFDFKPGKAPLPKGAGLLVIDTFAGKKSATSEMTALFAKSFGIEKPPQDLGEDERKGVIEEYEAVWGRVQSAISAREFGSLMNENHALLRERGVSSPGIERAVSSALEAGAWGAKLTAAGGEGGAVLALCSKKDADAAGKRIADGTGFAFYPATLSGKGACAE